MEMFAQGELDLAIFVIMEIFAQGDLDLGLEAELLG